MSNEENTAVVRGFVATLDDGDIDAAGDLLTSDYRLHFDGTLRWIVRPESVSSSPSSPRSPTSVTRCRIDSLERDDGHSGDRERDSQQRDQHHPRWPGQDRRTLWV